MKNEKSDSRERVVVALSLGGNPEEGLPPTAPVMIAELSPVFLLRDEIVGTEIESNDS